MIKTLNNIAREKAKAREFKKTQWWRDKLNQGTCYYCKKKYNSGDITMDHVVPMARGGKSTRVNIQNNKGKFKLNSEKI